jgi:hypothetical protein
MCFLGRWNTALLRTILVLPVALIILALPAAAFPQGRARSLTVEEMAAQADVAGVASVQSLATRLETRTGMICTDFRLTFSEVWKGDPGREFVLVTPGGELPGRKLSVPGHEFELRVGETIVVFATASRFGNHVVIGLRDGLYRVGPTPAQAVFRVTEFPVSAGRSSPLSLPSLKDAVWKALGHPSESRSPVPSSPPKEPGLGVPSSEPSTVPESPAPQMKVAAPAAPGDFRLWAGTAVLLVLVAVGCAVLLGKRQRS